MAAIAVLCSPSIFCQNTKPWRSHGLEILAAQFCGRIQSELGYSLSSYQRWTQMKLCLSKTTGRKLLILLFFYYYYYITIMLLLIVLFCYYSITITILLLFCSITNIFCYITILFSSVPFYYILFLLQLYYGSIILRF